MGNPVLQTLFVLWRGVDHPSWRADYGLADESVRISLTQSAWRMRHEKSIIF